MSNRLGIVLVLTLLVTTACSSPSPEAPAAPPVPSNWSVVTDLTFSKADIAPVAKRLGADVTTLRNTQYDVDGKQIKLNTIQATTPSDADAIMAALGQMKPEEFFVRRGNLIYEFVGNDAAIPEMREARELLVAN